MVFTLSFNRVEQRTYRLLQVQQDYQKHMRQLFPMLHTTKQRSSKTVYLHHGTYVEWNQPILLIFSNGLS